MRPAPIGALVAYIRRRIHALIWKLIRRALPLEINAVSVSYAGERCGAVERGGTRQPRSSIALPARCRPAVVIASPAVRGSAPQGLALIAGRRARPNTAPSASATPIA